MNIVDSSVVNTEKQNENSKLRANVLVLAFQLIQSIFRMVIRITKPMEFLKELISNLVGTYANIFTNIK